MGNILFSILFGVVGALIGMYFSNRLARRRCYFEGMIMLVNDFSSDIRFRQTNLSDILSSQSNSAIKNNVSEFASFVDGKTEKLLITRGDLTRREYEAVKAFFSDLGTYDLSTQIIVLENHKQKFNEFYEAARKKEKEQAGMSVKLGFMLGLAIGIMVM